MKHSLKTKISSIGFVLLAFLATSSLAQSQETGSTATMFSSVASKHKKLYELLGVSTIWIEGRALSPLVSQLRETLQAAPEHGLLAEYWTESLETMYQNFNPTDLARFESEATNALVKYATHLANGRVDPESVSEEIKVKAKSTPYQLVANILGSTTSNLSSGLETLAPQWPLYRDLKKVLAYLSNLDPNTSWPTVVAPTKTPKLGESNQNWANVKTRLRVLGYPIRDESPVYNSELRDLIRAYYVSQSLKGEPEVRANARFWKHIAVPIKARMQQVKLSMEKIRWVTRTPEAQYIYVNLALQKFRLYEQGQVAMAMRTINGRPERMSPMLVDRLFRIELNPDWTVPEKLIIEDKKPAVLKNPNFLREHNLVLYDGRGREISSRQVDWSQVYEGHVPFTMKQSPGTGNALGVLKFDLTNDYSIYMHDTNERPLFTSTHRLLSSGCVRLEHPLELAKYLLRNDPTWQRPGMLESNLATTPVADPGLPLEYFIKLQTPVPTYLMYLSVDFGENGEILFADDYYGQDMRLFQALTSNYALTSQAAQGTRTKILDRD